MKSTEELLNRIREQKNNGLSFLEQHEFNGPTVSIYLNDLLARHRLETRDAIRSLGLERTYGYQLFNGTRKPTRTASGRERLTEPRDYSKINAKILKFAL